MPAPVLGNITSGYDAVHNSLTKNITHTHNSGTNGWLFVIINVIGGYSAPANCTATFAGISMTKSVNYTINALGDAIVIFSLQNPSTVTNSTVALGALTSYNTAANDLSWYVISFTNCTGIVQSKSGTASTSSPITATFDSSVTAGNTILAAATGRLTFTTDQAIEIPQNTNITLAQGPNDTPTTTLPTGKYGLAYKENISGGSLTIETNHANTGGFNNSGIVAIEIGGASSANYSGLSLGYVL